MVHSYSMCWMPTYKVANGASEKIHEKFTTNHRCRRLSWTKYNKMQQQQKKGRWKNIRETVVNPGNTYHKHSRNSSWAWEVFFYPNIVIKQGSEDWPLWNTIHNFSSDKFNDIEPKMRSLKNSCTGNKITNTKRQHFSGNFFFLKSLWHWLLW